MFHPASSRRLSISCARVWASVRSNCSPLAKFYNGSAVPAEANTDYIAACHSVCSKPSVAPLLVLLPAISYCSFATYE